MNFGDMYSVDISTDLLSDGMKQVMKETKVNFNIFYRGVVEDVDDPLRLGRAKVRIPSIHGSNKLLANYIPTVALPWASPAIWSSAGNDMGVYDPPTPGNRVFVTFEGGNADYPIYFGGIPTKLGNSKYYKPQMGILGGRSLEIDSDDYNTDLVNGKERVLYKSLKGATIIISDFDGDEYIKIIDQAGQTFTMGNKGDALGRRGNKLGISSEGYIEISNNRGESIKIIDGKVIIDGDSTEINSKHVSIPNWQGGGGGVDAYTKEETDALLLQKSKVFFEQPTVPYHEGDAWYSGNTVYRCIRTRKNGEFSINDWEIDSKSMDPDSVEKLVYKEGNKILEVVSSTYVTPAYVDEKLNYEIYIYSSDGDIFKNNNIETTLTAYVRRGNMDISSQFNNDQFIWSRKSDNEQADIEWNRQHVGGTRSIHVTSDDVSGKATFTVELVDEINTVKYVKNGLIEIFDGYDAPTSTGEWMSMIRTNAAVVPSSGVSYDENKHAYIFNGVSTGLNLMNPITFKSGSTYEFVTELQSYTETQNILSSNEAVNDDIRNKIACAVAGHLTIKKGGKSSNSGNVKLNRKAYLSLRFVSDTEIDVYYNGDYVNRLIQSNWGGEPEIFNRIGRWCSGYIYSIRVYNRLLTPTEILNNYAEDLDRFS